MPSVIRDTELQDSSQDAVQDIDRLLILAQGNGHRLLHIPFLRAFLAEDEQGIAVIVIGEHFAPRIVQNIIAAELRGSHVTERGPLPSRQVAGDGGVAQPPQHIRARRVQPSDGIRAVHMILIGQIADGGIDKAFIVYENIAVLCGNDGFHPGLLGICGEVILPYIGEVVNAYLGSADKALEHALFVKFHQA